MLHSYVYHVVVLLQVLIMVSRCEIFEQLTIIITCKNNMAINLML